MVMLIFSQIAKVDIREFKRGRIFPTCTIELEWTGSGEIKRLSHKVNIIGAKKPDNYFYMRYSPQECEFVRVYNVYVCVCVVTMHVYIVFFCLFLFPDKYIANSSSKEGNDMLLMIFMSSQHSLLKKTMLCV